jgi:hypothetical protein
MCSRTFGDALLRLGHYKQLTCPEEIRIHSKAQETAVEFFYVEPREPQPAALVFGLLAEFTHTLSLRAPFFLLLTHKTLAIFRRGFNARP